MILRWILLFLIINNQVFGYSECPNGCQCRIDPFGVHIIICKQGGMTSIPVIYFNKQAEQIYISGPGNNLTIGPIFNEFSKLRVLRIINSNVPAIGSQTFRGLIYLRVLDLSQNNISTLTEDNFIGLADLLELNLSGNKIKRIPSATFRHLKGLHNLNLADNQIEELVPRQFYLLKKLKVLNLSQNPIKILPVEIFYDTKLLTKFYCRNCMLNEINSTFLRIFNYLMELDFGDNLITTIRRGDFNDLKMLKRLQLDGNKLSVIHQFVFEFQRNLEFLDLSRNELTKLTNEAFIGLGNLTELDLSYNQIEILNKQIIEHLINLHSLNVSGNQNIDFDELETVFTFLQDLQVLSLADMGNNLPSETLLPLMHLSYLNLSGNELDTVTIQLINPIHELEFLDLSNNNIEGFDEKIAKKFERYRNVRLDGNPIVCDQCHMGPIIKRIQDYKWSEIPKCYLPENLRGASITDLDIFGLEFCYEVYDTIRAGPPIGEHPGGYILFGAAAILSIIVITSCILQNRQGAKYYTNEEKLADDIEKNADGVPINGKEINFKFPLDDGICRVDDMIITTTPITNINNNK